jgi:NAD(P)-dependent dehydrogenase (short-subunit alcohol dehydrogenase family)
MEQTGKLLTGKVIIITGSTDGIGLATARECVSQGASVLIHGRDQHRAETVATTFGDRAAGVGAELADIEAAPRIVEAAIRAFGECDGLVNNAAWIYRSDLETTDAAIFDRVMAINVRAPMLMIKATMPYLKKNRGSIVNIGSVNAFTGEPRQLAYAMSKAALMTMSRNLANAFACDRVRINHFNVGWVLSENERKLKISEGLPEDFYMRPDVENVPYGRMTMPEDIARHVVFWLSDASIPISGSALELEQYPVVGRIPLKEGNCADA